MLWGKCWGIHWKLGNMLKTHKEFDGNKLGQ